jgi:hypothetical protein
MVTAAGDGEGDVAGEAAAGDGEAAGEEAGDDGEEPSGTIAASAGAPMAAASAGSRPLLPLLLLLLLAASAAGEGLLSTDMSADVSCARVVVGRPLHTRASSTIAADDDDDVWARMVPGFPWLQCCCMNRCSYGTPAGLQTNTAEQFTIV